MAAACLNRYVDRMKYCFLLIALVFNDTLASDECTITKAYMDTKIEAFKAIREPYNNCRDSMIEAYYWKAVAKCVSEGKGKNIGGGCSHLVSSGSYPREKYDMSHCDIFKWDKSDDSCSLDLSNKTS